MLRIVMPLSGRGRAFVEKGYTFPKPLIEIVGRPLIEIVVRSLTPKEPHRYVFVCRMEHLARYAMTDVLRLLSPGCTVVSSFGETGGALCSVLLAIDYIEPEDELLIANGDQYITHSIDDFLEATRQSKAHGAIVTFPATHPKWSYVRTSEDGDVEMVAEKKPISRDATAGIYYFRRGRDFLDAAERMMLKGTTTANEFYVAPVYNEMILEGKRVAIYPVLRTQMYSLGTPEDVEAFTKIAPTLLESC